MNKYYDAGDVDLDEEEVYTHSGQRLTEQVAAEMADDAVMRVRGRPSLSGQGQHSPQVSFRIPEQTARRAEQVAERDGKTLSQLGREALDDYLARTE